MQAMEKFLGQMKPTFIAQNVEAIRPDLFEQNGLLNQVDGVAFDFLGTLYNPVENRIEPSVHDTLKCLSRTSLGLFIIDDPGIGELSDMLPSDLDMRVISPVDAACGRDPRKFRKPNPAMLQMAQQEIATDNKLLVVGDQLKDVKTATRADAWSLLMPRRGEINSLQRTTRTVLRQCLDLPANEQDFPTEVYPVGIINPSFDYWNRRH